MIEDTPPAHLLAYGRLGERAYAVPVAKNYDSMPR